MNTGTTARIGLVAGPAVAAAVAFGLTPDAARGPTPAGCVALALGAWMAVWWMTEAVPLAATAMVMVPIAANVLATYREELTGNRAAATLGTTFAIG